jgi:hypothetical protein
MGMGMGMGTRDGGRRKGNRLTHVCEIELWHRHFEVARVLAEGHEYDIR